MWIFNLHSQKNNKKYDWAIGKKGLSMIAGIGVVSKEIIGASMKDPVIEGKKRGYQQAAEEFEVMYKELKREYEEAKKLFKQQLLQKDKQLNEHIIVLEKLESQKNKLEKELHNQAEGLNIDVSAGVGTLYFDFENILKNHPEFDKAKIDGYNEAKIIYKKKLSALKGQLRRLKNEADETICNQRKLITETLSEIAKMKMVITEMNLIKRVMM